MATRDGGQRGGCSDCWEKVDESGWRLNVVSGRRGDDQIIERR